MSTRPGAAALLLLPFLLSGSELRARVVRVPGDRPTIQSGIDAAADGDTVRVAPGLYPEHDIDFGGRAIRVTGGDPGDPNVTAATVVDARGEGRVFVFRSQERRTSILEGLTLIGGATDDWGGGVACMGASPTIGGCVLRDNEAGHGGGAILCEDGSPLITGNRIESNTAGWGGGGIRCTRSAAMIRDNVIRQNRAAYGGGIDSHYNSTPTILRNRIEENTANDGGGLYGYDGSSPVIRYNVIARNQARYGGGLHARVDCLPVFDGNTIVGNRAEIEGGGARCRYGTILRISNSILRDNEAPSGPEIFVGEDLKPGPSGVVIDYSDVEGGIGAIRVDREEQLVWGPGMIDEEPRFCLLQRADYRLLWGSACIDAGDPDSVDIDETRRDMGYAPYDQARRVVLYLTPDSTRVAQGGTMGVTYSLGNHWPDPVTFDVETEVLLAGGILRPLFLAGPIELQPGRTVQARALQDVPPGVATGFCEYRSITLFPPLTVAGADTFRIEVTPPGPGTGDPEALRRRPGHRPSGRFPGRIGGAASDRPSPLP